MSSKTIVAVVDYASSKQSLSRDREGRNQATDQNNYVLCKYINMEETLGRPHAYMHAYIGACERTFILDITINTTRTHYSILFTENNNNSNSKQRNGKAIVSVNLNVALSIHIWYSWLADGEDALSICINVCIYRATNLCLWVIFIFFLFFFVLIYEQRANDDMDIVKGLDCVC